MRRPAMAPAWLWSTLGYPAAPPGCGPPPGYGPPLGYGPPVAPGAVKPGIIPLRPLTLSDIFNGAVGYIRANPKATLGLTAMVVVTLQIISLVALFGPMTAFGDIVTGEPDELTGAVVGGWSASFGASLLVSWLAGVLLSGMLTVIVGRAVFGSPITVGEAWAKVRGRLLALFGLALLEAAGVVAVLGLAVVILSGSRRRPTRQRRPSSASRCCSWLGCRWPICMSSCCSHPC